jgi:succinate dehydrogenase / fumarate reductase flavoprotein subunit
MWLEMGSWMTDNVTVVRYNDKLRDTDVKLQELMQRYNNIGVPDSSGWSNQSLLFTRQLWNMLVLARVITLGALLRDESRGAHYKPEFPDRNDARFLKTTLASYAGEEAAPEFSYEAVDTQYIKPRPRRYDVARGESAAPAKPQPAVATVSGNGDGRKSGDGMGSTSRIGAPTTGTPLGKQS